MMTTNGHRQDRQDRQDRQPQRAAVLAWCRLCCMSEWTVTGFAGLSQADRQRVDALRRLCESAEPLDLKLEIHESDTTGESVHFLADAGGEVIGYAAIAPGDEAEACGMVHPAWRRKGIGSELLTHVCGAGRRLARDSILFICEDTAPVALEWLRRIGATDDSAEQRMTLGLGTGSMRRTTGEPLELRRAEEADRDTLARLLDDGHGATPDRVTHRLESMRPQDFLLGISDGAIVGTLRLTETPRRSMIYGFVIDRHRRGQRLGTRMLEAVLELLRSRGVAEVGLEVDPENTPAVRLYESLGFVRVTTYRYLRLASSLVSD
jgi:ribosomal protein S18 acetylase RimI-like enzyme